MMMVVMIMMVLVVVMIIMVVVSRVISMVMGGSRILMVMECLITRYACVLCVLYGCGCG